MRRRGFTLIELLVVIAIMGVVMSLVMPALSGMRARAMFVACRSNMNQIGVALHQYLLDYDSLPVIAAIDKVKDKKKDPNNGFPSLAEALYPYVETDKIFCCTVDNGVSSSTGKKSASCFETWGTSYDYNSDMYYSTNYSSANWFKKNGKPKPVTSKYLASVRAPSECVLTHDYAGEYLDCWWHKVAPSPTYNTMFLDLHVEGMTLEAGQRGRIELYTKKSWWLKGQP